MKSRNRDKFALGWLMSFWALCIAASLPLVASASSGGEEAVERTYVTAPPAPASQTDADVTQKSAGCMTCHTKTDANTMHVNPAVRLGCTDCHGGNAEVRISEGEGRQSAAYRNAQDAAHVLPRYPESWHYPSSANPERTYTLLNKESPEFVRFINPSDYRIARESCGACHMDIIQATDRSLHNTTAMFWATAAYSNGILDFKQAIIGETYDRNSQATLIKGPKIPDHLIDKAAIAGIVPQLWPLPPWETLKQGDIFRVFERGGRNILNVFPETGLPDVLGQIQRLEEPGRPDFRQSNRGPGTGARIAVPVINITKTRLNDPNTWFIGTNDQPGDYRHSGCASCHVVYANDRDPRHSSVYAKFGHDGKSQTIDPTISKEESGHPLTHTLTRAVPTSQCMICHMHQPNMFVNSFLGYTMWDYESDAPFMWPEKQKYPTSDEMRDSYDRNPEGAALRGKWSDPEFLRNVSSLNPQLKDTQFADYHGHGWNFRGVYKRDRKGNLLDAVGNKVGDNDPDKWKKTVLMSSVHVDVGMQCIDCHFSQDTHGNGYIYSEVAAAVEIDCKDCHGTARAYPNLYTSGPAALGGGNDLTALRTPDGRRRFEWVGDALYQRSMTDPNKEWKMSLVKDTVDPLKADYNEKAARAKLMSKNTSTLEWGQKVSAKELAHTEDDMECYTCHMSWTTSCAGCHLPIQANQKSDRHHYEGGETRNYATYNPQVARDDQFLLGRREVAAGGKIAPFRSSSALVLSSENANRERIYIQQAPVAASGYSSQVLNPHYPHTERKTETKTCTDCHLSKENDNNAWMAQLFMFGTNFVNFVGFNAWVGGDEEFNAVRVTEWEEPQAVIGSYLHRYAYPDWYANHQKADKKLEEAYGHSAAGEVNCLQLRGEYLYVAEGPGGFQAYDVASIANKGISQRIITAPFSPMGHNTQVKSKNATCVVLPTNQPVHPARNKGEKMRVANMEDPHHPIYNYAFITDAEEGLILVDVNTMSDGEPRNNFFKRALTWNPNKVLEGAQHITMGGYYLYITTKRGLAIVNADDPLKPELVAEVPLLRAHSSALQFRYLFVTDAEGVKAIDVTNPRQPRLTARNIVRLEDAKRIFVARTYAYVAAGRDGVVIVDIEKPDAMKEYQRFNDNGKLVDTRDVIVASTNASLFAYVADGKGGLKVLQMTSPESQPKFYGFSPDPKPQIIASYATKRPALALSKGLERDRAIDETGNQVAVFGRRGAKGLSVKEQHEMYLDDSGKPWYVTDTAGNTKVVRQQP